MFKSTDNVTVPYKPNLEPSEFLDNEDEDNLFDWRAHLRYLIFELWKSGFSIHFD